MAEVRALLDADGFSGPEIAAAVAELETAGALDDHRFARRFAEDKRELAGWGEERIREALERRGAAEEAIDAACSAESAEGELERALALLARRGAAAGDDAARRRALSFLVRRGYELDLAYEAVRRHGRGTQG